MDAEKLKEMILSWVGAGRSLVELANRNSTTPENLISTIASDSQLLALYNEGRMQAAHLADRERIRHALQEFLQFDFRDLLDDDGNLLPVGDWPASATRCFSSIRIRRGTNRNGPYEHIDFKIHDKLKASQLLGEEIGMFSSPTKDLRDATQSLAELLHGTWDDAPKHLKEPMVIPTTATPADAPTSTSTPTPTPTPKEPDERD